MKIGRLIGRLGIIAAVIVAAVVPASGSAVATVSGSTAQTIEDREIEPLTAFDCMNWLQNVAGYALTEPRVNACVAGQGGTALAYAVCVAGLALTWVKEADAVKACTLASRD